MRFGGQVYSLQFTARVSKFEQTRPELVFIIALSATREFKWKFCIQHLLKIEPMLANPPLGLPPMAWAQATTGGTGYAEQETQDSSGR
jgi:hypothetical protein